MKRSAAIRSAVLVGALAAGGASDACPPLAPFA